MLVNKGNNSKKQWQSDGDRPELTVQKSSNSGNSVFTRLKVEIITLIGSAVVLPILAVGTATYYFGSQAIDKQIVSARRSNNTAVSQAELVRQQNLLKALLVGTGATALVAGGIAALGTKKLIDGDGLSTSDQTQADEPSSNLNLGGRDILKAIVEEARSDLHCDRVVVYSLARHEYGTIVAESVAAGYTQAIGSKIDDPFERGYLDWYGNDRAKAIDDIEKSYLSNSDRQQLRQLEVKANLVTPIFNEGRLLGLLVAHQCNAPRKWQQLEINLLHRAAEKAGMTIENARLCDRLASQQSSTEEDKSTHYFDDAVRHIRQSLRREDILNISVEEAHRFLKCDRVIVYSLEPDNYGAVVAESVSAGYSRTLNTTIEDLNLYRDGVRAVDNIHEAQLSQGDIEQLETLEVKASLITPISNQLILVAHQCSQPRNWQDREIRWMAQIAPQIGFALDNAGVLAESAAVREQAEIERKWTYYFDDAVRHIRQSFKQEDILNISVEEVHRVLKCDRVIVYSLEPDNYGAVVAESVSAGYSKASNTTIEDLNLYRDGIRAVDNIYEAQLSQGEIEQLETLEVKASLVAPILNRDELSYLLVVHQCSQPRNWQDYEIRWTAQIATQISFALDNAILSNSLQHDERSMQLLNDFSLRISQAANKSELLNTAVEQVRKIIKLDRAVIYFNPKQATVVAESVVSGYPQASSMEDLDLSEEYKQNTLTIETMPRLGGVIADIHESGLSDRYLKQLELLGVKATITAPIMVNQQLFGLLIGHQCQQPRSWSQQDTDLFIQLALQIGLVLDRLTIEEAINSRNSQNNGNYARLNNLVQTNTTTIIQTTNIEHLNRLEPDLYQMLGTLHDLRESDRQTKLKLTPLPTEEITVEAEEITDSANNLELPSLEGFVEKSPSTPIAIDSRLKGDINELSARISQQSLSVTESFQKLATFAKQLSEKDK